MIQPSWPTVVTPIIFGGLKRIINTLPLTFVLFAAFLSTGQELRHVNFSEEFSHGLIHSAA
jgi:hypothetical protein